jgi:hypothetical protein
VDRRQHPLNRHRGISTSASRDIGGSTACEQPSARSVTLVHVYVRRHSRAGGHARALVRIRCDLDRVAGENYRTQADNAQIASANLGHPRQGFACVTATKECHPRLRRRAVDPTIECQLHRAVHPGLSAWVEAAPLLEPRTACSECRADHGGSAQTVDLVVLVVAGTEGEADGLQPHIVEAPFALAHHLGLMPDDVIFFPPPPQCWG